MQAPEFCFCFCQKDAAFHEVDVVKGQCSEKGSPHKWLNLYLDLVSIEEG